MRGRGAEMRRSGEVGVLHSRFFGGNVQGLKFKKSM